MQRRDILAAAAGAVLATVLAGSVAWAAIPGPSGVIQGCYDAGGNVKVVEALPCPKNFTPFQWHQQGPPGQPGMDGSDGADGVSPTVTQLAAGDANCPAGGAAITDAAGTTAYVCSGQDGADGEPFSGTFASPSGEYSISVTNAGIVIGRGPTNSITVAGEDLAVRTRDLGMQSDRNMTVQAGGTVILDSQGNLALRTSGSGLVHASGRLDLQGSVVQIN